MNQTEPKDNPNILATPGHPASVASGNPDFRKLFVADLLVRSAYQVGKAPVLAVFAASLGASNAFLGLIVSLSVMTGIVGKPLFGILSDRWGRRTWLLIGTGCFALIPFAYGFVQSSEELALVRLVHGLATAIYGPVAMAAVIQLSPHGVAERLGWFGMARGCGYIIGPSVGGWLLLSLAPHTIYQLIGAVSLLAFLPVLFFRPEDTPEGTPEKPKTSLLQEIGETLQAGAQTFALWMAGLLEASMYLVLYTLKTFLPLYAMKQGISLGWVGVLLSLQEGTHLLLRPFCGKLADRWSLWKSIALGLASIGLAVLLIPLKVNVFLWGLSFFALGVGQAFVTPTIAALAAKEIGSERVGAGMGFIGALRNAGKVAGPIGGGLLMGWFSFAETLWLMAGILLALAFAVVAMSPRMERER